MSLSSVVVARLEKVDPNSANQVDDPVLLGEAAGPGTGRQILQRLRLPDSLEGVAHDRLDQVEGPERNPAVGLNPEPQILAKFGVEDGFSL
jgi:hypothetical protein